MLFSRISYLAMASLVLLSWWKVDDPNGVWWVLGFGSLFLCTACITFSVSLRLCWVSRVMVVMFGLLVFLWSKSLGDTSLETLLAISEPSETARRVQELWALVGCFVWSLSLVVHDWLYPKTRFSWLGNCGAL